MDPSAARPGRNRPDDGGERDAGALANGDDSYQPFLPSGSIAVVDTVDVD